MKTLLLAAALAVAVVAPARAESVDLSTITCAAFAEMDSDAGAFLLIWLDGWLSGQDDRTTFDPDDLNDQIDGIAELCREQPELSVMNAAKQYYEDE